MILFIGLLSLRPLVAEVRESLHRDFRLVRQSATQPAQIIDPDGLGGAVREAMKDKGPLSASEHPVRRLQRLDFYAGFCAHRASCLEADGKDIISLELITQW